MTRKRLILHVNRLQKQNDAESPCLHVEESEILKAFLSRGWECYLVDWRNVDLQNLRCSSAINAQTREHLSFLRLNKRTDLIIARSLGSVMAQRDQLAHYFVCLEREFGGAVINHPQAVLYGMTKFYLFDLAANSQPVIQSRYFDESIAYEHLIHAIPWPINESIVKPISGECGNCVEFLCKIDEQFLRRMEGQVHGWIVQPYMPSILRGEISVIYVDKELIFAVKKTPTGGEFRVNERWHPTYEIIEPSERVVQVANTALDFWPYPVYLARVDLICDVQGVLILEVETVNPGFLYGDPPYDAKQLLALDRLERLGSRLVESH